MSGERPPLLDNGPNNKSGVIILYVLICTIISVIVTGLRLYISVRGRVTIGADDILLFITVVRIQHDILA